MAEFFESLEQIKSEINSHCQAVVVSSRKGCFVYGEVIDLRRDLFPNSSYWKNRLELWKAGAGNLYGKDNVFIVEGVKPPEMAKN